METVRDFSKRNDQNHIFFSSIHPHPPSVWVIERSGTWSGAKKEKWAQRCALACFHSASLTFCRVSKVEVGGWARFMFMCVCALSLCVCVCALTTHDCLAIHKKSLQGNKWAVKEWRPPPVDDKALQKCKVRLTDVKLFHTCSPSAKCAGTFSAWDHAWIQTGIDV